MGKANGRSCTIRPQWTFNRILPLLRAISHGLHIGLRSPDDVHYITQLPSLLNNFFVCDLNQFIFFNFYDCTGNFTFFSQFKPKMVIHPPIFRSPTGRVGTPLSFNSISNFIQKLVLIWRHVSFMQNQWILRKMNASKILSIFIVKINVKLCTELFKRDTVLTWCSLK